MGPSYCDCRDLSIECSIYKASQAKVQGLSSRPASDATKEGSAEMYPEPTGSSQYYRGAFSMPDLEHTSTLESLCNEATELVKHSKDTFWLDKLPDEPSGLEQLAWYVYQNQEAIHGLQEGDVVGIEWWVQVKSVTSPDSVARNAVAKGEEAVDLHYDKDETMAEVFGLGSFPYLSTVTYLTDSFQAPPTVVFPRIYDDGDEVSMSEMLVSRPKRTKHLAFDGRLLHGAPAHYAFRSRTSEVSESPRVTFLVNIWTRMQPLSVRELPQEVRSELRAYYGGFRLEAFSLVPRSIAVSRFERGLDSERVQLPFVGKGTTWDSCDEEDEEGTALSLVSVSPPPVCLSNETFVVEFSADDEACLTFVPS